MPIARPAGLSRRRQTRPRLNLTSLPLPLLSIFAASLPPAMAQQCIPLTGSSACPAFSDASISTNAPYPFLAFVSDVQSFDDELRAYVNSSYARRQYVERMGCSSVNLDNTTGIYARYTTSVLCNFIVQASIAPCGLSDANSRPLCVTSCGDYAISEREIISTPDLCGSPGTNSDDIVRADFQDCSTPARALAGSCIEAAENEPDECGYLSNLSGLCGFCAQSTTNNTDSCCVNSNVESRCQNVRLPEISSRPPMSLPTGNTAVPTTPAAGGGNSKDGLSGGAIAGIVVGSVLGAALILAAVIFFCIRVRRRQNHNGSFLNAPAPARHGPEMGYHDGASNSAIPVPGARVARMSALEEPEHLDRTSPRTARGFAAYRGESSASIRSFPKRDGSLSGRSALAISDTHSSPLSGSDSDRNFSSPEGLASGQSEQLNFFKDYYSQDDIRPNDTVATLWAYQPRANDEHGLERGDMLKVVGIWDDGWATGIKLTETAEQWEARKQLQRDSGVSNGSRQSHADNDAEIKAFPLVCVCLPQHWRKTIEGDSTDTGAGSGGDREPPIP